MVELRSKDIQARSSRVRYPSPQEIRVPVVAVWRRGERIPRTGDGELYELVGIDVDLRRRLAKQFVVCVGYLDVSVSVPFRIAV